MDGDNSTQKPSTPIPCANQCGFFGNPLTANMCSKCYRDNYKKSGQPENNNEQEKVKPNVGSPTPATPTSSTIVSSETIDDHDSSQPPKKLQTDTSKCFSCSKKIGLLGFKCRCDYTFCSTHRYSDKHECSYDYKSAGKAALAKANPVVQGSKITKI